MEHKLPVKIPPGVQIWTVQLANSNQVNWEQGVEKDILHYNWEGINLPRYASLKRISFALARVYPAYADKKIEDLATTIKNVKNMRIGDYVLGVEENKVIEMVGYIEELNYLMDKADITIKWVRDIPVTPLTEPIFHKNLVIQKVSQSMWKTIQIDITLLNQYIPSHLRNELIDHPPQIFIKDISPIEEFFTKEKGGAVSLFYGTNRNRTGSACFNEYYGDEAGELQFGLCEVNIPKGHIQGDLERPKKIWKFEFKENLSKHVAISNLISIDELEFIRVVSDGLSLIPKKAAFVFIHGYNVSFAQAARRAAQIDWDIPFHGLAGFFSWPSGSKVLDYFGDIEKADNSILPLQEFIEKIIEQTGIEQLHLIAHSMGNRILTTTLKELSQKTSLAPKLHLIRQIVLGAADLDQLVFMNNILPAFRTVGERRTLYTSNKDTALRLAKILRSGLTRLGESGSELFVTQGVDTVDVSNVPSSSYGHGYIFDTKELLSDLYYLLDKGFAPVDRRLKSRQKNGLNYWLFPE